MKKTICTMLLLVFILTLMTGCSFGGIPREVEQHYIGFLDAMKTDFAAAAKYCYHETPEQTEMMINSGDDYIVQYEILEWKQLNDSLWVVKSSYLQGAAKESELIYQFVGYIDGKLYVMQNPRLVPEELKGDLDLEIYRFKEVA